MAMVLRDGMTAREEGFCDRAYRPDGGLVDRARPGAVLTEPGGGRGPGARAWPAARWWPTTARVLTLWVDTLCIHGDSPGAVAIATAVRRAMADAGIEVVAPGACMTPRPVRPSGRCGTSVTAPS